MNVEQCMEVVITVKIMEKFKKELEDLLNRNSMENGSNTPDFMLAEFLANCLANFNETVGKRAKWYQNENTKESFDIEGEPSLEVLIDKILHIGVPLPVYDYHIRMYVTEIPVVGLIDKHIHESFRSACEFLIDWGVNEGFFDGD